MATINLGKVKGEPFRYEDFTPEQLESLKGKDFKYEDFSPEQLDGLKSKVKIGTVETLDADQKATVTSSVDGNVTTLNIGIPRGNGVNSYSGTREEYEDIADTIKDGSLVNITDENDFDDENLIGQVTMQRLNDIEDNFDNIKPHALTNPTNNLLATEPGTALDAVQGKVLYDRDVNMSVGRLAFQNKNAFGTLEEFVQETAKDISTPIIARIRDTTGAWGPGGNIQWYKCLVAYQNPYGSQYSLGGSGFMWDDAGNKWSIEITGNSNTTINFKHEKLVTETDLVPKWGTITSDVGTVSLGYALKIGHQLYVSAIIQLTSEVSAWNTPVLKVNGFTFNTYSINYLQVVGYLYNATNGTYNNMWAGQWEAPNMSLKSAQKCNANDHIRVTFTTLCD